MESLQRSPTSTFKDAAKSRVLKTFREWDSDGSGAISKEELVEALAAIGVAEDFVGTLVERIDANSDGDISYQEFVQWVFGTAGRDLPSGAEKILWAEQAQKEVFKAVRRGDADGFSKLMQRDELVNIDASEEDGCTLLMAAAQRGHLDVVQRLLEMNCSALNVIDDKGFTALDHARTNGNSRLLDYMLVQRTANDASAVPFIGGLLHALERGDAEALRQSVRPRVVFNIYVDRHEGDLMGIDHMPCGLSDLVIKEINAGGLIDEWNMKRDDLKVMPGDHIVQVNDVAGDFKLLKKELVKYQEMTITIHRYSEEEGFDPNTRDKNGNSALHLAVRSGKLPLVEALASSPDLMVNAKDRYCRTALDIAKDNQFDDIFAFLKKKCARLACEVTSPQREHNRRSGRAATALAKVRSEAEPADAAPPEAEEQRPKTAETLLHTMTGPC